MKGFSLLSVILAFKVYAALYLIDHFGLNITYSITYDSKCRTDKGRFARLLQIGLPDCVRECGLRKHCKALSYSGTMPMCDLFYTVATDEGNYDNGACIYILGADIKLEKSPCMYCENGQVCDMHSQQCKYEECIPTTITNGTVLGNLNAVGSKIRYKCNKGYRDNNGIQTALCKRNGRWNVTANCTRVCKVLVHHGTVALTNTNMNFVTDTASLTCDSGYHRSVDIITCTASGDWNNATCDPIACGNPVSPANGALNYNGTLFPDKATVTCDDGYHASVDAISCTASGQWENVTCDSNNCYKGDARQYSGTKNITKSGHPCERWDKHIPRLSRLENYCRYRRWNRRSLWCYSSNPDEIWEYCDIPEC